MAANTAGEFCVVRNVHAKSNVWKHFSFKKSIAEGEIIKNIAVCDKYGADVKYSGGTTNLFTHLRRHHPSIATPSECSTADKPKAPSSPSPVVGTTRNIAGCFGSTYTRGSTRAKAITDKMARFIVKDLRPFAIVDSAEFRELVHCLDPRYRVPNRQQFSEITIPQMYAETTQKVKADLAKAELVALTTDGWSSRATESYMTITSVHINDDWEMKNYVLQTRALPESHTGEHVAQVLSEAVTEWNIPRYRGSPPLVSDNASNMVKAASIFETILHVPCYAHTINLACQKSLKIRRMSNLLPYIRQIVAFFHRSNIAAALLKSKAELLTLPQHKLIIDVCTRWNSTHDMLQRFLEMQVAVFAALRSKELSDKKAFKSLTDDDITLAEDAVKLLKPLKDITLVLCSDKTPTVSYIMPLQHQLIDHLSTVSDEDSPTIREMKPHLPTICKTATAHNKTCHPLTQGSSYFHICQKKGVSS